MISPKRFLLFYFLLPFAAVAQVAISGKVSTTVSHSGIGRVSVFLSNSSYGTETAEDGSFQLVGVKPGQYTLVASFVGYQTFIQQLLVERDPIHVDITLAPKVTQLRGVSVTTPADWKKNLELFKKEFIGTTENAKKCEITNPHDINMVYSGRKLLLEAWTSDFLLVENRALGYRVKFLIDTFSTSGITGMTQWQGQALFEELKGSAEQKRIWNQRREASYFGSSRHFLRSLYSNTLKEDGFIMRRLHRELNPDRPDDGVIHRKINYFRQQARTSAVVDSFNYWVARQNLSKYYHESLSAIPLEPYQVFLPTRQPGLFALHFTECLYVIYTKRREESDFKDLYRPLDMENYEISVLTATAPYAIFDRNGVIVEGVPVTEGTWSKAKLSELLPFDYRPTGERQDR